MIGLGKTEMTRFFLEQPLHICGPAVIICCVCWLRCDGLTNSRSTHIDSIVQVWIEVGILAQCNTQKDVYKDFCGYDM